MGNKKIEIFNNLENLLKNDEKISAPLAIAHGEVIEEWIDYNGHMNMAYYVQCFEESSDYLLEAVNLGYEYALKYQKGVFVIKCEINYKKEIKLGQSFYINLKSIECKGKKLIVDLIMTNEVGLEIADYRIFNLNVNLNTKKSISFDKDIINQLS